MPWVAMINPRLVEKLLYPLPDLTHALADQPVERIEPDVAGFYFRSILLEKAGTPIPQHAHDHDHATLVCSGAARVWIDGEYHGDFGAGRAVEIKAGKLHVFQALEPQTRLCCVHNIESAESVQRKGL